MVLEPSARVVHPVEHAGYWEPIAWARRYEMDPLLAARHPDRFRERIEILRVGSFTVRRVFVRACFATVIALAVALMTAAGGDPRLAGAFVLLAAAAFLPVWAKWGFNLLRLPVALAVPFVLVFSYARGMRSGFARGSA
ncbi:MAG: hypothetical protein ACRENN_07790 [Candidatus Eiseniibacteriota bacterium]